MKLFKTLVLSFSMIAFIAISCQKDSSVDSNIDNTTFDKQSTSVQDIMHLNDDALEEALNLGCFNPTLADPTKDCPALLAPVCACGTITFLNACEASRLGFVNTTPGACSVEVCHNPLLASLLEGTNCAAVYQPVCGCDGKTYSNSCAALVSGVSVYTPGECGSIVTE